MTAHTYDLLIKNALLYDGSGAPPVPGSLAVRGQHIVAVGAVVPAPAQRVIDAAGQAVAPGFINMLSWAAEALIADGRSQSEIRQGVTLEVMGEGYSYGPLNEAMKQEKLAGQADFKYDIPWTSLDEHLEYLVHRGVSTNVASFVGAGTLRTHVMGYADRPATSAELEQICGLARQAMRDGAMGVAAALVYVPDIFYSTDELVALAKVAADYDGMFVAHMRGEGDRLLEGIDEMIEIARRAGARTEIYHLKAAGWRNWNKLEAAVQKIEAARAEGLQVTADMYPYAASGTGLDVCMPPWVQEGGLDAWVARLKDPDIRARVAAEMVAPAQEWENNLDQVTSPEGILFAGFNNPALKPLTGKTLAEVAALRGASPVDTVIDLVIEDHSPVSVIYFTMNEDNLRKQVRLPWISLCSDARSMAPEGHFLLSSTHPRAYGAFARFLGHYVRDEGLIPLEEAIHRLTGLPAANLKLSQRGRLLPGYFADVVIFDPARIQDHATFLQPQQYATGVSHVLVNGVPVIQDGEHTGAKPGQVVRGPGRLS